MIGGIGVNILQEDFEKLPKAGSIFTQTRLKFEAKEFANSFHHYLFENLTKKTIPENVLDIYHQNLYKKEEIAVFEKNKTRQNGIIKFTDENGCLWIELEREGLQKFFHKEIELLY